MSLKPGFVGILALTVASTLSAGTIAGVSYSTNESLTTPGDGVITTPAQLRRLDKYQGLFIGGLNHNFPAKPDVSGNTITQLIGYSGYTDETYNGPAGNYTFKVNQTITLPNSPAGDVIKFDLGYGSPTDPAPDPYQLVGSPDLPKNCTSADIHLCIVQGTVNAADLQSLTIAIQSQFYAEEGLASSGESLASNIDIQRFKADGVTPDPFTSTPEPSSFALLGLCVSGLGVTQFRKKSNESDVPPENLQSQ